MSDFNICGEISGELLEDFNEFLDENNSDNNINISITSYGGDIFAGIAFCDKMSELRKDGKNFNANVYGLAASAAAIIALGCDSVTMSDNSYLLLHSAWTESGEATESVQRANASMLNIIRRRVPDFKGLSKDVWYSARDAKSLGLIDNVSDSDGGFEKKSAVYAKCMNIVKCFSQEGKMDSKDEEKKDEMTAENAEKVEEKSDDVKEEKTEASADDVKVEEETEETHAEEEPAADPMSTVLRGIEAILDRLDMIDEKLGGRVEAECGDDKKDEKVSQSVNAVLKKINAVAAPAQRKAVVKTEEDAKADLDHFNKLYPDISALCND